LYLAEYANERIMKIAVNIGQSHDKKIVANFFWTERKGASKTVE